MKSNLAVLSSDNKTIQFIKNNNLQDLCNLYANSSRNTDDAKIFSENHGFEKYYGINEYPNQQDFDGTWGIFDEPYLQYWSNQLSQEKKPFLSSVFTLSSHNPYPVVSERAVSNRLLKECLRNRLSELCLRIENAKLVSLL